VPAPIPDLGDDPLLKEYRECSRRALSAPSAEHGLADIEDYYLTPTTSATTGTSGSTRLRRPAALEELSKEPPRTKVTSSGTATTCGGHRIAVYRRPGAKYFDLPKIAMRCTRRTRCCATASRWASRSTAATS